MVIRFHIEYKLGQGEAIALKIIRKQHTQNKAQELHILEEVNESHYFGVFKSAPREQELCYKYCVLNQDGVIIREEAPNRKHYIRLNKCEEEINCYDQWIAEERGKYLYSSAFEQFYPQTIKQETLPDRANVFRLQIQVSIPTLAPKFRPYLLGEEEELGAWRLNQALALRQVSPNTWSIELNYPKERQASSQPLIYKFLIKHEQTGAIIWEEGENRTFHTQSLPQDCPSVAHTGLSFRIPQGGIHKDRWAGWVIPLFALRTPKDWGIGDFSSLKSAIRWSKDAQLKIIQLLPINETSFYYDWRDSYPYNAISVHALHPIYCDLNALGKLKKKKEQRDFEQKIRQLQTLKELDYPRVMALKKDFLWAYFQENKEEIWTNQKIDLFIKEQADWIIAYQYYCLLRDHIYPMKKISEWQGYEQYNAPKLEEAFSLEYRDELRFYAFVQYLLHNQLKAVVRYAKRQNIILKGDIPIGVAPHSLDVWQEPKLFHQDRRVGAPPDSFAQEGQDWGFPSYNWDAMKQDNYAWWRKRLEHMAQYFDAYRIDHILGFFRIWTIPSASKKALEGYFSPSLPLQADEWQKLFAPYPIEKAFKQLFIEDLDQKGFYHLRIDAINQAEQLNWQAEQLEKLRFIHHDFFYQKHNELWKQTASERLSIITSSNPMLSCSEDLGMIPATVPDVLEDLELLSLELERIPKQYGQSFTNMQEVPYLSVTTSSSHDMPPLRLWFAHLSVEESEQYLKHFHPLCKDKGTDLEEIDLYEALILRHLQSKSMLIILPFADLLALAPELSTQLPEDEQINHPENPKNRWMYRMPFSIESQAKNIINWTSKLAQLIQENGLA